MMNYHLLPQFMPARLQDLVLWYEPWSFRGRTWRNLAPCYTDRNHGTANGGVGLFTWHPQFPPAPIFYGDDEYVKVPDSDSLNTKAITVELWYKTDSLDEWNILVSRGRWGTEKPFLLGFGKNLQLYCKVVTTGGNSATYWGAYGVTNEWTHLVFTYDAVNGLKTYKNAEPKNTAAASGDVDCSSTLYLTVGAQDNFGNCFHGSIDELRIYKAALTPAEVVHNYTHHPLYFLQRGIDPYMFVKKGGIYYVM